VRELYVVGRERVVLDELVGGMMTSLRPKSRASSESAPGPRQIREAAITVDKAEVMWV